MRKQSRNRKIHYRSSSCNEKPMWGRSFQKHIRSEMKYSEGIGPHIPSSSGVGKDPFLDSYETRLADARVLYCVAPALGHNQESHPESNFRVPAIMSALEKMELTTKFRSSEVVELQNFKPASVDDITSVHSKAYVSGLEKVILSYTCLVSSFTSS
ncbi:hypothetical protein IFM89_001677 [Coptis chinensis]|uniref:Histone deacetylase n=1 Tax=Coptis chinensis TaxID=261450 RepID=A0A835HHD7_9MAGN|nr:hypothetical protein IFM89_001677 [Coptis chinensis]